VEKTSHFTNKTPDVAFQLSASCDQCGLDPATIVDAEAIGLVEQPPEAPKAVHAPPTGRSTVPRKPTRAELETKVRELEAELKRLRGS
jgi:hypothetical protein